MNAVSRPRRTLWPLFAVAALIAVALLANPAMAQVPGTMQVEGVIQGNGGPVADGKYKLTFGIYKAKSGGAAIWTEEHADVAVAGGRFSLVLGSIKAVDHKAFDGTGKWWLGMKVADEAELPRVSLHTVPFASRAAWADNVSCTNCVKGAAIANGSITAQKVGFAYAGAADSIKGGPAADLKCTGCVSATTEVAWDGDLDLKGKTLTAAKVTSGGDIVAKGTVAAKQFVGDGSKLTGITSPKGDCPPNEAVVGIAADGTLKCKKITAQVQADQIDEISNGLIHNQFQDSILSSAGFDIKDNNPNGVTDTIDFPDIGIAQELKVHLTIQGHNGDGAGASGVKDLRILLFPAGSGPPNGAVSTMFENGDSFNGKIKSSGVPKHYVLHDKNGQGINYDTTYPTKTKPVAGDLTEWHGKNPKGKWFIAVIDTKFRNNGVDGKVVKWGLEIKTLSNKKIKVSGDTYVEGKLYGKDNGHGKTGGTVVVGGDLHVEGKLSAKVAASLWFPEGSRPFLFGTMNDQLGSNVWNLQHQYSYASNIPMTNQGLHEATDRIVWGDQHGNYRYQQGVEVYDSRNDDRTQARMIHFVKSDSTKTETLSVCFYYSSRSTYTSIARNGSNIWSTTGNSHGNTCQNMTFPAGKSSVVALKSGIRHYTDWYGDWGRLWIGYYNDTWSKAKLDAKKLRWDYEAFYHYMSNTWVKGF